MGVLARAGGALKSLAALPFRVVLSSKLWALMLAANYLAYHQSKKNAERMRRYAAFRTVQDLDEESVRLLLGNLPAWLKFEDFERARFVNQVFAGMWPYLDATICTAIRNNVEPIIQENLPFPISGFEFEKLSFGDVPWQVRGVKHAPLYAGESEAMALSVELEASWLAKPDIVAKCMPSKRWALAHVDIRPTMWVKVDFFEISGRLRLSFPLQSELPIFNGMAICFMETPQIDISLKMLGGVDIMSMPALQEWATQLIASQIGKAMTYPHSIDVTFTSDAVEENAPAQQWPQGIATASLRGVHLPKWQTQACMPSLVVRPPTWLGPEFARDVHAMTYPLVMDPQRPDTLEEWQAAFPVFHAKQVLTFVVLENAGGGKAYPVTTCPLPLAPLLAAQRTAHARHAARHRAAEDDASATGVMESTAAGARRVVGGVTKTIVTAPKVPFMAVQKAVAFARADPEAPPSAERLRVARSGAPAHARGVAVAANGMVRAVSDPHLYRLAASTSSLADSDCPPVVTLGDMDAFMQRSGAFMPRAGPFPAAALSSTLHGAGPAGGGVTTPCTQGHVGVASPASRAGPSPARVESASTADTSEPALPWDPHWEHAAVVPLGDGAGTQKKQSKAKKAKERMRRLFHISGARSAKAKLSCASDAGGSPSAAPATATSALAPASAAARHNALHGLQLPDTGRAPASSPGEPPVRVAAPRVAAAAGDGLGDAVASDRRAAQMAVAVPGPAPRAAATAAQPTLRTGAPAQHGALGLGGARAAPQEARGARRDEPGSGRATHSPHCDRVPEHLSMVGAQVLPTTLTDPPAPPLATYNPHDRWPTPVDRHIVSQPRPCGVDLARGGGASEGHHARGVPPLRAEADAQEVAAARLRRQNEAVLAAGRPTLVATDTDAAAAAPRLQPVPAQNHDRHRMATGVAARVAVFEPSRAAGAPHTAVAPQITRSVAMRHSTSGAPRPRAHSPAALTPPPRAGTPDTPIESPRPLPPAGAALPPPPPPQQQQYRSVRRRLAAAFGGGCDPASADPAAAPSSSAASDIFDNMWSGPGSAWDMAALQQGIVTRADLQGLGRRGGEGGTNSSTSALSDLSTLSALDGGHLAVQMPSSPGASEGGGAVQGGAPAATALRYGAAPHGRRAAPLVARTRAHAIGAPQHSVEVWLPGVRGTAATMQPGGGYVMMRRLRHRSWYQTLNIRWGPELLRQLPAHTVADMRRCAAAMLTQEAHLAEAARAIGAHARPTIRSYNTHGSPAAALAPDPSHPEQTPEEMVRRGGTRLHVRARAAHAAQGVSASVTRNAKRTGRGLKKMAAMPFKGIAGVAKSARVRPALPPAPPADGELDTEPLPQPRPVSQIAQAGVVSGEVTLEANEAAAGAASRAPRFHGFAGCVKAQLEWLPLQWTFLARDVPAPPAAVVLREGLRVHTGVLAVHLLATTIYGCHMLRPQVLLQLHHLGLRTESRRTGVRERWASKRSSLRHGTAEWGLKFSFCVDVPVGDGDAACAPAVDPRLVYGRYLQLEVLEVEASLSDRLRTYWAPALDADVSDHVHQDATTRGALLKGSGKIPLEKLLVTPNKPRQALWQLHAEGAADGGRQTVLVGNISLETTWLPACESPAREAERP